MRGLFLHATEALQKLYHNLVCGPGFECPPPPPLTPPPAPPTPPPLPPPTLNPEATAWANQVVTNGGNRPSDATILAASNFLNAISSIRSRIHHLNFIAADSLIAMRTPLIHDFGSVLWTAVTKGTGGQSLNVTGWLASTDEVNGTVYDCGVTPSLIPAFSVSNGGMSVYFSDPVPPLSNGVAAGAATTGLVAFYTISAAFTPINAADFACWDGGFTDIQPPVLAKGGFLSGNRTATNANALYYGNSTTAWGTLGTATNNVQGAPIARTVAVGCNHTELGAFYQTPTKQRISFFAIHDGFTSANAQILFNAAQELRVELGGGYL